jgi:hypothetical protein
LRNFLPVFSQNCRYLLQVAVQPSFQLNYPQNFSWNFRNISYLTKLRIMRSLVQLGKFCLDW